VLLLATALAQLAGREKCDEGICKWQWLLVLVSIVDPQVYMLNRHEYTWAAEQVQQTQQLQDQCLQLGLRGPQFQKV